VRGRHFVGAFYPAGRPLPRLRGGRATGPDPTPPGLSRSEILGGRYGRIRLREEPPALYEQIPEAFDRLVAECNVDPGAQALSSTADMATWTRWFLSRQGELAGRGYTFALTSRIRPARSAFMMACARFAAPSLS